MADGGHRRRLRIRQDVPGHRHPLRRGHAPFPGGPEHLQPPAADPGPAAGRRPDRPPATRAGAAPASAGARPAQHGRDHDGGPERPAPDDVPAGLPSVPERAPRRAVGRDPGHGDRVPGVRRALRAAQRRILLVQLLWRLPGLQRPGRAIRGRRRHPRPRPGKDHRAGRRPAVERGLAPAVPVRGPRARGPARRPVPGADPARKGDRAARRAGPAAGDVQFGPVGTARAAQRDLRERHRHRGAGAAQRHRGQPRAGTPLPGHPDLLGLPRHPAAPRGADFAVGRPEHRPDQRAPPGRAALVRGRPARRPARRAGPPDRRPDRRAERHAHAAARRRARLPPAGPLRRVTVGRRTAADRAHLDGARKYHRHALRARRAVGRAAPQQHRGPAHHDRLAGPERQFRRHRGARAGNHAHRGLDHRARPRRRGSWRHHHRRGHPGPDRGRPALDHGPVSRRDGHRPAEPGRAARPRGG